MDARNKNISVDDILNEYTAMEQRQKQPEALRTTVEVDGDQVWRPAQRTGQTPQNSTDPMQNSGGQDKPLYAVHTSGSRQSPYAAQSVGKEKTQRSSQGKPNKPENKKKTGLIVFGILLALAGAGAGSALGYTYITDTIFPGVTAGSIEVGGLTLAQAADKIAREAGPLVENGSIPLKINGKEYPIAISEVTGGLDALESANAAFQVGHTGSMPERVHGSMTALMGGQNTSLVMKLDEDALKAKLDTIASEALTEPAPESWEVQGTNMILTMPKPGISFEREKVQVDIAEKIKRVDFSPYEVEVQRTEPQPLDIAALKQKVDHEPMNAIVDKTDGKTIIPEQQGVVMDIAQAQAIIGDGSAAQYTIPVSVTPAKVTKDALDRVLFRDVLASASTSLNTGNKQRTNNVTLAAQYMNGTILNPGEEFSYNGVVGPRTLERGFKAAGAYLNGKVIDDVGGGVCQPSSTLYMSVLRADLEVTERTNHSLTVSYTPLGQDATVNYGSLDFRFKNNTDYPIKILAVREGGEMKTKILGTKVDDKTVKLETEVLETLTPTTVEKKDPTLEPGTQKVDQTASTGYKTATYKYVTVNGQTTKELANRSHYKKSDKIILVGPEKQAPPEETKPQDPEQGANPPSGQTTQTSGSDTTTSETIQPEAPAEQPVLPEVAPEIVPPPES